MPQMSARLKRPSYHFSEYNKATRQNMGPAFPFSGNIS